MSLVLTAITDKAAGSRLAELCDEIIMNIAEKADEDRGEAIVWLRLLSRQFKGVGAEAGFYNMTIDGKRWMTRADPNVPRGFRCSIDPWWRPLNTVFMERVIRRTEEDWEEAIGSVAPFIRHLRLSFGKQPDTNTKYLLLTLITDDYVAYQDNRTEHPTGELEISRWCDY